MFTAFRLDEPSGEQEGIVGYASTASPSHAQFSRTACDICRAKKLKCRGTGEICEECIASSNVCTYTFSSGIGPGKKRRRKVVDSKAKATAWGSHLNSSHGSSSAAQDVDETVDLRHAQKNNNREHPLDTPNETLQTSFDLPFMPTNTVATSNDISKDQDGHWADITLTGSAFAICPGKHHSKVSGVFARQQVHANTPDPGGRLVNNSQIWLPDQGVLQQFDGSPASGVFSKQLAAPDPTVPPSSQSHIVTPMPGNGSTAGPNHVFHTPIFSTSDRQDCSCNLLPDLPNIGPQRNTDINSNPTDTLFLFVENGMEKLSTIIACSHCNFHDENPMLMVTSVNHLAIALSELVHRLTHCQSADTAPSVFQFGRYSVTKTKMRTSLLASMIELHVGALSRLIGRVETSIAGQTRLLLAGAKSIVTEMLRNLAKFGKDCRIEYRE
ncbi:hypothetical protein NLG97_g1722 [Lecanicillium saksenae]|uniref:Uncharacterized protein n=1 Tax=Lecanicillium saksenae TaxID=468837 RepID=A0ACC1R4C1_9HYPO|nr:hypothetical protein NLG97_g1722 [Lecanicillium saksenae]